MTGNKCLLDTCTIIATFRNDNTVWTKLDLMSEVYVPAIVVGELFYGAYKSADPQKHIIQVDAFLKNCRILPCNSLSADAYGRIKAALMQKGRPIPENDVWIAAIARQYDLPLFTIDKHFSEIDGISLVQ